MTFFNKSIEHIKEDVFKIVESLFGFIPREGTTLHVIYTAIIKIVYSLYQNDLMNLRKNIGIDEAQGEYLDEWGVMIDNVMRLSASHTIGTVHITTITNVTINKNDVLFIEGEKNVRYFVIDTINIPANTTASVHIKSEFTGSRYNINNSYSLLFLQSKVGISKIELPFLWIVSAGTDVEGDDAYRFRIKAKLSSRGLGDTRGRHELIIRSVTGVVDTKIIRTPRGYGSKDIIVMATNGEPSDQLMTEVQSAMADTLMIARDTQFFKVTPYPIEIKMKYLCVDGVNYTEPHIKQSVIDYCTNLHIGGILEPRNLYDIFDDTKFDILEIRSPVQTITASDYQFIFASVTFV